IGISMVYLAPYYDNPFSSILGGMIVMAAAIAGFVVGVFALAIWVAVDLTIREEGGSPKTSLITGVLCFVAVIVSFEVFVHAIDAEAKVTDVGYAFPIGC